MTASAAMDLHSRLIRSHSLCDISISFGIEDPVVMWIDLIVHKMVRRLRAAHEPEHGGGVPHQLAHIRVPQVRGEQVVVGRPIRLAHTPDRYYTFVCFSLLYFSVLQFSLLFFSFRFYSILSFLFFSSLLFSFLCLLYFSFLIFSFLLFSFLFVSFLTFSFLCCTFLYLQRAL